MSKSARWRSSINVKVYDVIAALPARGCSMREVVKVLPNIDHAKVISAVHRMSEKGALVARHHCVGLIYSIAQGATRPTDGRGRPRKREQIDAPA
jgi:hypothetical protein